MAGYTGDVAEIESAHKAVSDVKIELDTCNKNLAGANEDVLTQWEGTAATSYRSLSERVQEKFQKQNEALEALSELLQQAGSKYTQMEEEGAGDLGGFSEL